MKTYAQYAFSATLAWWFFQANPERSVMERLASYDWSELVTVSLELTKTMGLTHEPPQGLNRDFSSRSHNLDINYSQLLANGPDQDRKIIPNLNRMMALETLVPLQPSSTQANFGLQRIFQAEVLGQKTYLCMLSNGQLQKFAYYATNGSLLEELDLDQRHRGASLYGQHLALLLQDRFQIYELTPTKLLPVAVFPIQPLAAFLQSESGYAQASGAFSCSDFQFEPKDGQFIFWAFNVGTTAFLPGFLHLKFSFTSSGKVTAIPFGKATRADRLPVNAPRFRVARIKHRFWVPRSHDAQIDIFDLEGQLVKTAKLAALHPEIAGGSDLTSANILQLAVSEPDQASFYRHYQNLNFIAGVYPVEDFVLVARQNSANPTYARVYTLLNRKGGIVAEDFSATDLELLGYGSNQAFSIASSLTLRRTPPPWLLEAKLSELEKVRQHEGWWLLGFKINPRAGHDKVTEPQEKPKTSLKPQPTAKPQMSAKLKTNLLRAEQLRNILTFDGFVKLKLPPDLGMKQITDALFLDNHYFIVDEPGEQVLKFDRAGQFVQTISQKGQGPGEFDSPHRLTRAFDGHFALGDRRGVLLFDSTGKFLQRPEGFLAKGLTIGGDPVVWNRPNLIIFADPFSGREAYQHFGLVTLAKGKIAGIKGFGERAHASIKNPTTKHSKAWTAFRQVGDQLWVGSPYEATIQIYDLDGNFKAELKQARHPIGMTLDDHKNYTTNKEANSYFYKNRRLINRAIHPLGPIVIRTLAKTVGNPVYDVFDFEGHLLAKALGSGASAIDILDTHDGHLVGKILIAEYVEFTEERLRKMLYQREYTALFEAGFAYDEEDSHYLWLAHLP